MSLAELLRWGLAAPFFAFGFAVSSFSIISLLENIRRAKAGVDSRMSALPLFGPATFLLGWWLSPLAWSNWALLIFVYDLMSWLAPIAILMTFTGIRRPSQVKPIADLPAKDSTEKSCASTLMMKRFEKLREASERDSTTQHPYTSMAAESGQAQALPSLQAVQTQLAERLLGCLLGGALGDARGGPYEGRTAPFDQDAKVPLRLSDDTQLTLATCEAIGAGGAVEPELVAASFLKWYRARRLTGLGASTLKALRDLDAGAPWALAGRTGEFAAGNGAAMRVAPLAFCLDMRFEVGRRTLRDVCWITHQSDEAYAGALAIVIAIQLMASNTWQPDQSLPALVANELPDTNTRDTLLALADRSSSTPLAEIACRTGVSGYVAESVPLALFAAQKVARLGFQGMLDELIRVGGDTDTIASMAGQIGGAWLGIPAREIAVPPEANLVIATALHLVDRLV